LGRGREYRSLAKVSTPVNWKQGEDVIVAGSVSDEEARELFGGFEPLSPTSGSSPQPNGKD
jgi:hypothetical protein